MMCECQGSNLGPFAYQANALPAELHSLLNGTTIPKAPDKSKAKGRNRRTKDNDVRPSIRMKPWRYSTE